MNKYQLPPRTYHDRINDEKIFALAKEEHPEYLEAQTPQFDQKTLAKIGIDYLEPNLPEGYIKKLESDFIVEEIDQKNNIVTIAAPLSLQVNMPFILPGRAIFQATLIKKGMSTIEAVERIAEKLSLPINYIKYAGIKDARAITSQKITISRMNREDIKKITELSNIIIKDVEFVSDPVGSGQLQGNFFTITVRTKETVNVDSFERNIKNISENGFLNFFSLQRFGSRLINAEIGKLILEKKYEEALKMYMTSANDFESSYFQSIRNKMLQNWGYWQSISEMLRPFKYSFYYEKAVAEFLVQNPGNFKSALWLIQSQTQIFVFAYFSYLFNKLLSHLIIDKKLLPTTLPLYRPEKTIRDLYLRYFPESEFSHLDFNDQLPFLMLKRNYDIPVKIKMEVSSYEILDNAVILKFSFGKGAYATTFLQNLFNLRQGFPQPTWLEDDKIDSKKIMGETPISEIEKIFEEISNNETA